MKGSQFSWSHGLGYLGLGSHLYSALDFERLWSIGLQRTVTGAKGILATELSSESDKAQYSETLVEHRPATEHLPLNRHSLLALRETCPHAAVLIMPSCLAYSKMPPASTTGFACTRQYCHSHLDSHEEDPASPCKPPYPHIDQHQP